MDEVKSTGEIDRLSAMLSSALGVEAEEYLSDDSVIELMINPDGKLWIDRLGVGRSFTGSIFSAKNVERVIFIVASAISAVCNRKSPILSAELPGTGARFQGILPPITTSPVFSIRKKAIKVFSLNDYVLAGIVTKGQGEIIKDAVRKKKNILIAGGTGSGKTTLANALLALIAKTGDRLVIIEDTLELQSLAEDTVHLKTKDGVATMTDLLRATMRLRPDRIIIGEVRGPEALALLKAWNTGHPGGVSTIHANSATRALTRLEGLVAEAAILASKHLIGETVDLVLYIEKTRDSRKLKEIISLDYKDGEYITRELIDW